MANEKRTHVGRVEISWYEKRVNRYPGDVDVIGWYQVETGVLKGQMSKALCGVFNTEKEAEAMYGDMNWHNKWTEPSQSLDHLPGEDDPVAGGMYPDDW